MDDSRFAGWKKLELYDGARKVDELPQGQAEFTVKDLKAGYYAFSVLGTDCKGNIRPCNPVLVVVRKLAATSQPHLRTHRSSANLLRTHRPIEPTASEKGEYAGLPTPSAVPRS